MLRPAGFLVFLLLQVSSVFSAVTPPTGSFAKWAADSGIARGQGNGTVSGVPAVSYEHGEFQWALRLLYEASGNRSYYEYIKRGVDTVLSEDGKVISGYK